MTGRWPRFCIAQRRITVALCLAALALLSFACQPRPEQEATRDSGATTPWPRYWLKNTTLLDAPDGRDTLEVLGPVLVELMPEGRVRSVAGATPVFDGYLPAAFLEKPQRDQGLMLYAQRTAELRVGSRKQRVVGRVHPGAFLGVVPGTSPDALVGVLPFRKPEVL